MTESLTLGSVHLIGEHMPTVVRVTVVDDLERPAGFLITTAQWNSLLALADVQRQMEREREQLCSVIADARFELGIAASYAEQPGLPAGLRVHAKACRDVCNRIDSLTDSPCKEPQP